MPCRFQWNIVYRPALSFPSSSGPQNVAGCTNLLVRYEAPPITSFKAHTHRRRGRDATRQLRRIGGVYWALNGAVQLLFTVTYTSVFTVNGTLRDIRK